MEGADLGCLRRYFEAGLAPAGGEERAGLERVVEESRTRKLSAGKRPATINIEIFPVPEDHFSPASLTLYLSRNSIKAFNSYRTGPLLPY
jgi:hypothetical protein